MHRHCEPGSSTRARRARQKEIRRKSLELRDSWFAKQVITGSVLIKHTSLSRAGGAERNPLFFRCAWAVCVAHLNRLDCGIPSARRRLPAARSGRFRGRHGNQYTMPIGRFYGCCNRQPGKTLGCAWDLHQIQMSLFLPFQKCHPSLAWVGRGRGAPA
jgi:hypothetical protein